MPSSAGKKKTLRIKIRFEYEKHKITKENLYNSKKKDNKKMNEHIQEKQNVVDSYINMVSGHRPVNKKK